MDLPEIYPKEFQGTFVPHHFVFHHKVLNSFFLHVENNQPIDTALGNCKKNWIELIVSLSKKFYRFSEYKNMSTFTYYFFPQYLHYHPFKNYGEKGIRIRDSEEGHLFLKKIMDLKENKNKKDVVLTYEEFLKFISIIYKNNLPSYIQVEHL